MKIGRRGAAERCWRPMARLMHHGVVAVGSQGRTLMATEASLTRYALLALLALFGVQTARAQTAPLDPAEALADYVAKPDDAFEWHVQKHYTSPDASVIELHLQSQ